MRWAPPKIQTGSQGDSGTMILILVILCCVSLVVGGAIWFVFFRKSEGDDCTPKNNPNALGVLDSNLDCIFSVCKPTYALDATGNCVIDQSGTICSPAVGNQIDKGVYTKTGGVCTLRGCESGYKLENLSCVPSTSTPGDVSGDGTECDTGYELISGICMEEIVEGARCTPGNRDTNATSYTYKNGVCTLTTCKTGFDLKDGSCVADTTAIVTDSSDIGVLSQVNPTTVTIQSIHTGDICAPIGERSNVECTISENIASDDNFHFVFIPLGGNEFHIQTKKDYTYCREGSPGFRLNCDALNTTDAEKYHVEMDDDGYTKIKRVANHGNCIVAHWAPYSIHCNTSSHLVNILETSDHSTRPNVARFKLVRQ